MPLKNLARAFARFATGRGLAPQRAAAAKRLRAAVAEKPWYVSGTGAFCTVVMQQFGERVFIKGGAEGVICAALPEQGLGIAVKCDDGAGRAAEVVAAAIIARLLPDDPDQAFLDALSRPTLHNWRGVAVGGLQPAEALARARLP